MTIATDTAICVAPSRRAFDDGERRRRELWDRLLALFRHSRPDMDELALVTLVASLAGGQVFEARKTPPAEQDAIEEWAKDFAECAALYGYVLGVEVGRLRAVAADAATPPRGE